MKKVTILSTLALAVVSIAGFNMTEMTEYFSVFRKNINETIKESIPLDVEIGRMEVIAEKMNKEVNQQKYKLAKAHVSLEAAEAQLANYGLQADSSLSNLARLRKIQCSADCEGRIKVGCQTVSQSDVRAAMAHQMKAYNTCKASCEHKTKAVEAQDRAFQALKQKYNEWNQQRELLAHKIETLRSRNEMLKANRQLAEDSIDTSELQRARKLASDIETRLNVSETQHSFDNNSISSIADDNGRFDNLEVQVDQLLGNQSIAKN